VIAPGEADRFQVRLRHPDLAHHIASVDFKHFFTPPPLEEGEPFKVPGGISVYLLRLNILCNADDRHTTFRPLGVACPSSILYVPTPAGMTAALRRLREEVEELRQEIDREMTTRGRPACARLGSITSQAT
jgi:hypothetical protein